MAVFLSCHSENIRSNTKQQSVLMGNRSPFTCGGANTILGVAGTAAEPVSPFNTMRCKQASYYT